MVDSMNMKFIPNKILIDRFNFYIPTRSQAPQTLDANTFFLSVRIDFVLLLSVQSIQIFDILLIPAEQVSKSVDHIFSATYLSDSLSMPVLGFSFWQCSASWVWIEHFADDTDADVNLHKKLLGVKFCLLQRSDGLKKRRRRKPSNANNVDKKAFDYAISLCSQHTFE